MDRAGKRATPMTIDELTVIFEIAERIGGDEGRHHVIQRLSERDRTTVSRAYKVVSQFEIRGLDKISESEAEVIADSTGYSTNKGYVLKLFLNWKNWKFRQISRIAQDKAMASPRSAS